MVDANGEYPTVIGSDAKFKGELTFEKGVRIEGKFDGQISSQGALHIAEGASVTADVEATNVRVEGECKGNIVVSEKLHLLSTAKMEGDLHTNRLEIADGAIFVGNVAVGQHAGQAQKSRPTMPGLKPPSQSDQSTARPPAKPMQSQSPDANRPRPQEVHVSSNPTSV
jgi:cytoskeletal protein CcmA (bactofilin family)